MVSTFPGKITRSILKDDLTLVYAGAFSDRLTDRIIELAEIYLESDEEILKMRKKASFLVAECFQNVIRHGSRQSGMFFGDSEGMESFVIRFHDRKCFIMSENAILRSHVDSLRSMLDRVNRVDRDSMRELYRKLLAEAELSPKGGAGLGLIEMARRSGNKLLYSFHDLDESHSIFHMMLILEQTTERTEEPDYADEFGEIEDILLYLKKEKHFMVYHGTFDRDFSVPVAEMIERNLDAQARPMALKVKYYHTALLVMQLIETLELQEHGACRSIISLGNTTNGYRIIATSVMSDRHRKSLEPLFRGLDQHTSDQRKSLQPADLDGVKTEREEALADLLLQLARACTGWRYAFSGTDSRQELVLSVEV